MASYVFEERCIRWISCPTAPPSSAPSPVAPELSVLVCGHTRTCLKTAFENKPSGRSHYSRSSAHSTSAQDPATGEPMEHFRNTPVEKKQPVRTHERFSQVVSHLLQPNGRLLVVSEWGGRSVKASTGCTRSGHACFCCCLLAGSVPFGAVSGLRLCLLLPRCVLRRFLLLRRFYILQQLARTSPPPQLHQVLGVSRRA